MATWSENTVRFGTTETPQAIVPHWAGFLTAEVAGGAVRTLSWRGIEILRGISGIVRDQDWAWYQSRCHEEHVVQSAEGFCIEHHRQAVDDAFAIWLTFTGNRKGLFRSTFHLRAYRDFLTNRAGFTILHPLDGLTGAPLRVVHSDNSITVTRFPSLISPCQVAFDIAGLNYFMRGIQVEIRLAGDVFEMEDQRNWSDASFKTYCPPLSAVLPYRIAAGQSIKQEIEIDLREETGRAVQAPIDFAPSILQPIDSGEFVPNIALAWDAASIPDRSEWELASRTKPQSWQLRLTPDTAEAMLQAVCDLAKDEVLDFELVVPQSLDAESCISSMARYCERLSVPVHSIMALPEPYLRSHQPEGPWPEGPTPMELCSIARKCFPSARIGGGVFTYFAEFNRCPPDPSICDYVSHGSTAIVHAADDDSVTGSIEGLRHVYASARALAGDCEYRLGLVSIGMGSNPYGASTTANPRGVRTPMAQADPRQHGLFAAAWAVGAVAATLGHNVCSLALASIAGPLGIVHRRQAHSVPIYDELSTATVYPLFHVVCGLSQMAGSARLSIRLPHRGMFGVASKDDAGIHLIVSNLAQSSGTARVPGKAHIRRLDSESFEAAMASPNWLAASEPETCSEVKLDPCDVAFVDIPKGGA